jgi:serine/threonine protein kinase
MSPKRVPSPPPAIPGYTYVSLLGTGGFADVFLYEQERPRRRVAVKVLLQDMLSTVAREQFDAEANLMAQLSTHPSIVTIYEAAIATDGRPYLAMEYCSRPNLGATYRREPMGVADALRIGVQVAGAVETAHRAGILHRDIKPANILVTEYNRPALTDFGISATTDGAGAQAEGMSIPWSPPESFSVPPRSGLTTDVWALAATIYSLLAGRSPFEIPGGANGGTDLISRIERVPLPQIGRADIPDSLQRVLATAMAKPPGARYSTALALARALQHVQTELQLAVTPIDVLEDVLVADAGEDDDEPGTRIRSLVLIDPSRPDEVAATVLPGGSSGRPRETLVPPRPAGAPDSLVDEPADTVRGRRGSLATGTADWGGQLTAPGLDATVRRTDDLPEPEPEPAGGRGRVGAWVAAAVLVGVLGSVGFVVLHSAGARSANPANTPADVAPLDPVGTIVPAATGLAGVVSGASVAFSWTDPNPEPGDTFLWRVPGDFGDGTYAPVSTPAVSVPVSAAGKTCLEVLVVRSGKSSIAPARACVP